MVKARSELTERLVRYLKEHPQRTTVTYEEMSQQVGEPMASTHPQLTSARRILKREHAQFWKAVRCLGLYRQTWNEAGLEGRNHHIPIARRRLRRQLSDAKLIDIAALSPDVLHTFAIDGIMRSLAADSLSQATRNKLETTGSTLANQLPKFDAVEWLVKLGKIG